jgi:hypothetical protein
MNTEVKSILLFDVFLIICIFDLAIGYLYGKEPALSLLALQLIAVLAVAVSQRKRHVTHE